MERGQNNPNHLSDYEKFACDVYNDVDYIIEQRNTPSMYKYFDERYCKLQLTEQELTEIADFMLMHAVDPPHSVEITLQGRNPYIYKDVQRGFVWITLKHNDETNTEVTTEYAVWMDRTEKKPINAFKDVKRAIVRDDAGAYGLLSLPLDISHIYYDEALISQDEQRAITMMLKHLQRYKNA